MISIIIPFRTQNNDRDRLMEFVLARYTAFWPKAEIIVSDNEGDFNRSAARNRGVEASSGETLVIADADTIINKVDLEVGTTMCATTGKWVLPYNDRGYWNLNHAYTYEVLSRGPQYEIDYAHDPDFEFDHRIESWAGVLIIPREAFEAVNGYDERFKGWGYEDNAFRLSLDTLWGRHLRNNDGNVFHLYHNIPLGTTFDSPNIDYNRARFYETYGRAARYKEDMIELVKGNR